MGQEGWSSFFSPLWGAVHARFSSASCLATRFWIAGKRMAELPVMATLHNIRPAPDFTMAMWALGPPSTNCQIWTIGEFRRHREYRRREDLNETAHRAMHRLPRPKEGQCYQPVSQSVSVQKARYLEELAAVAPDDRSIEEREEGRAGLDREIGTMRRLTITSS